VRFDTVGFLGELGGIDGERDLKPLGQQIQAVCRQGGCGRDIAERGRDASALPRRRSRIQIRARTFSPKPGQRNAPLSPRRNQLTWKMRGGFGMRRPISSQCPK
jgi:hypothetical protein